MNTNRIQAAIEWYNSLPRDYNDVDTLLTAAARFSCAIYDYSIEVGDMYQTKAYAEFKRKKAFIEARAIALDGQERPSYSAADALADQATIKEREEECLLDAKYAAAKLILDSANNVLQSMRQTISYLKDEKKYVNQTQN